MGVREQKNNMETKIQYHSTGVEFVPNRHLERKPEIIRLVIVLKRWISLRCALSQQFLAVGLGDVICTCVKDRERVIESLRGEDVEGSGDTGRDKKKRKRKT